MVELVEDDPRNDLGMRSLWQFYNAVGGSDHFPMWHDMANNSSLNDIIQLSLYDREAGPIRDYGEEEALINMYMAEFRELRDKLENAGFMEDGQISDFGLEWSDRTNRSILEFYDMSERGLIHIPETPISGEGLTGTDAGSTIGDYYSALGFPEMRYEYPEALPILHMLVEEGQTEFDAEKYGDGAEALWIRDMIEYSDRTSEDRSIGAEATDLGEALYRRIVEPDYEWIINR